MALLAAASALPVIYSGCGVQNPSEPNWGYPTPTWTSTITRTFTTTNTPGGPTNTPTITLSPTITTTVYPTGTFTLSPTPTVPGFLFNTAPTVAQWAINTGSSTEGNTGTTGVGFNSSFSGGCTALTGAMEITIGFTAINQALYIQDTMPSPVDMSGDTITVILEVNGGWNSDSEQVYGAIFLQENVSPYASLYQHGTGLYNASTSTTSSSGCVTLSLTIPSASTAAGNYANYNVYSGTFDPTQSQIVGIQLGTGGGGNTFASTVVDVQSWLY